MYFSNKFQIDFLQQKNREVDRKYRDAMAERSEMDAELTKYKARFSDLELEFQSVDRHAKRLETDKNIVLKTADREMEEAKDELEKSRHEMEDLDLEIAQLKAVSSLHCQKFQREEKIKRFNMFSERNRLGFHVIL